MWVERWRVIGHKLLWRVLGLMGSERILVSSILKVWRLLLSEHLLLWGEGGLTLREPSCIGSRRANHLACVISLNENWSDIWSYRHKIRRNCLWLREKGDVRHWIGFLCGRLEFSARCTKVGRHNNWWVKLWSCLVLRYLVRNLRFILTLYFWIFSSNFST